MKTNIKKASIVATTMCAVVATAGLFGACGSSVDYTTLDYNGWAKIEESVWDGKEISYQIEIPKITSQGSGLVFTWLFNLYDDGTMLLYQSGLYDTGAKEAAWYDLDRHITWAFFGFWDKAEDGSQLDLYYYVEPEYYGGSNELNGDTVRKEDDWADGNFRFHVVCEEKTAGSGSYVLAQSDTNPIKYLLLTYSAESFPIALTGEVPVLTGNSIKYKTLQAFVDSYIDGPMVQC